MNLSGITSRVVKLLDGLESVYTDLSVISKPYGYAVSYVDGLGLVQLIDIYVVSGKRTSYIVRWTTNGNLKLRLPAL